MSDVNITEWVNSQVKQLASLAGAARLQVIWNVANRLGEAGDIDGQVSWLRGLMQSASKEVRLDFSIRAFSELRRIYQTNPNYADLRRDVLWYFKWLVEEMPAYVDVPLATIEQIFAEMTAFYTAEKEHLAPVYSLRCQAAINMGQRDLARQWYEKWQAEPPGESDDCAACVIARKIVYLLEFERFEEAVTAADPILKGQARCDDTPDALTRLIGPCIRLQKDRLALAILKLAGRTVRKIPKMLTALASHVVYQLMSGNVLRSRRLLLVALIRAQSAENDLDRFNVYRAAGLWSALVMLTGKQQLALPARLMPGAAADASSEDAQQVVPLAESTRLFLAAAQQIAEQFDARNQTTRYMDRLKEVETSIRQAAGAAANPDSNRE